jgi:hypothetical protein
MSHLFLRRYPPFTRKIRAATRPPVPALAARRAGPASSARRRGPPPRGRPGPRGPSGAPSRAAVAAVVGSGGRPPGGLRGIANLQKIKLGESVLRHHSPLLRKHNGTRAIMHRVQSFCFRTYPIFSRRQSNRIFPFPIALDKEGPIKGRLIPFDGRDGKLNTGRPPTRLCPTHATHHDEARRTCETTVVRLSGARVGSHCRLSVSRNSRFGESQAAAETYEENEYGGKQLFHQKSGSDDHDALRAT